MAAEARARVEPVDLVLAAAFTLALQLEIWAPELFAGDPIQDDRALLSALSLAISLPLAVRRRNPWTAALLALGAGSAMNLFTTPPEGLASLVALMLVSYSLGRYTRRPEAYAGGPLVLLAALSVGPEAADIAFDCVVLGASWAAGLAVGARSESVRRLEEANRDIEQRRLQAAQAGAEEERLRIAGELHDVVAHRVSMIVVQSQAADALLDTDAAGARRAIRSVEDAARRALTELRQVLGVLTHDERAATVGTDLGGIAELVEDAAAAGLPVTFTRGGRDRPVAPVVALAAYRIVQEALTNVLKHAAGAPARVRVCMGETEVEVTVEDDGPGSTTTIPGHGLSGMAERAAFVGGRLTAATSEAGGFRVHAVLPVPQELT